MNEKQHKKYIEILWGYEKDPRWIEAKALAFNPECPENQYKEAMITMNLIERSYQRTAEFHRVRGL